MTVLVTGATGTVGRHVVGHLLQMGQKVRALTRNPAAASLPDGVEVVAGDLTDAATLAPAFDGVTAAHMINFGHDGYQPLRNGQEIVDAALAAGVTRVTMLGGWHEGTLEPAARASTLEWTQLQPIEFMGNTLADWGKRLRTRGVIREPHGDRRSASVHESDIAAVAAAALTQHGHAGQTYLLTGPEALTARDKVRIIGEATGRDLRFEEMTPDQARVEWTAEPPDLQFFQIFGEASGKGTAEVVEHLLRMYGNVPPIGYTVVDTVERVTGHPARTFAQWASEHAHDFQPRP